MKSALSSPPCLWSLVFYHSNRNQRSPPKSQWLTTTEIHTLFILLSATTQLPVSTPPLLLHSERQAEQAGPIWGTALLRPMEKVTQSHSVVLPSSLTSLPSTHTNQSTPWSKALWVTSHQAVVSNSVLARTGKNLYPGVVWLWDAPNRLVCLDTDPQLMALFGKVMELLGVETR